MNILFTCAGRRKYLIEYFRENLASDDKIVAGDMQTTAPALSAADIKVKLPSVYDNNYIATLIEICKQYSIRLLISLNDLELPILAKNRPLFEQINTTIVISNPNIIETCFDKWKTIEFAKLWGITTPSTYLSVGDAISGLNNGEIKLPLILKPRWGSGSIGIEIIYDIEDLKPSYQLLAKKIQRSILNTASDYRHPIVIQECLSGVEYGIDIMNDLQGKLAGVSIKRKIAMRAGETDKAITVSNEALKEIAIIISKATKHIGNLDCDIIEHDGKYYLIDLNPRFGGGFPFSYVAGVNLPKALILWASGEEIGPDLLKPKIGVCSVKCDTLVYVNSDGEVVV